MINTTSTSQITRDFKNVIGRVNKSQKPLVILSRSKPIAVLISLDLMEKYELNQVYKKSLQEYKAGKTQSISAPQALQVFFAEVRSAAK